MPPFQAWLREFLMPSTVLLLSIVVSILLGESMYASLRGDEECCSMLSDC